MQYIPTKIDASRITCLKHLPGDSLHAAGVSGDRGEFMADRIVSIVVVMYVTK
jgi:hypothetical protein